MVTTWRLIAHWEDPENVVKWAKKNGRIGMGWNPGDIRRFGSPRDIAETVRDTHVGLRNWPYSGTQLWNFCRVIKAGDLLILSTSGYRASVFEVKGDYEYDASGEFGLHHQRTATETYIDPDRLWKLGGGCTDGDNIRWTLIRCANQVDPSDL